MVKRSNLGEQAAQSVEKSQLQPKKSRQSDQYDLIFIGGGTAALAGLSEALELGVESVAVIEKAPELGGECAFNACVPTKTMLTASRMLNQLKQRGLRYGITDLEYRFHYKTLMETVNAVIHEGETTFLNDPRVTIIQGEAHFTGDNTLQVGERTITSSRIIVATGSKSMIPPIEGLTDIGYLTFQQATHLEQLPASLVVVGGGPVGVEFSHFFQSMGVHVTLLQKEDRLLPHEEPEISQAVEALLTRQGVDVITNCEIDQAVCSLKLSNQQTLSVGVETLPDEMVPACPGIKCLDIDVKGQFQHIEAEEILIATGMLPNIDSLNLSAAGVKTNPKGINVNSELQTSNPHVWAIGDVIGQYQFTHVADYHAVLAVRNALKQAHEKVDYQGIGWAVFTEPAVAHIGLTEAEARSEYPQAVSVIVKSSEVSRYRIESEADGFMKLIVDNKTQQILGGHIFASDADDMAHILMLGIRHHLSVYQLLDSFYIYPSKAQLVQKALEKYVADYQDKHTLPVELFSHSAFG